MNQRRVGRGLLLLFATSFFQHAASQDAGDGSPRLVRITESVFRTVHRPGATNSVVIVTDEGLAVVDGTCRGEGSPEWLKAELGRLYDVPVKYVILSHDHEDHICGLQVFDDTAVTVSHASARKHIVREGRNTSIPDVVFEEQMEIHLGGKTLFLYHFGHTHSNNLIQIHLPEEGVLIAPDIVWAERAVALPDFRDAHVENLIETLGVLARLDNADIVIPGHAEPTTQQGFLDFRDYVVALRDRVLNEMVQGASIEQIIERVTMDDFADYLNMASWRRTNIISMWDNMYRWREPNYDDSPGNYQSLYPIGYPIGEFGLPQ